MSSLPSPGLLLTDQMMWKRRIEALLLKTKEGICAPIRNDPENLIAHPSQIKGCAFLCQSHYKVLATAMGFKYMSTKGKAYPNMQHIGRLRCSMPLAASPLYQGANEVLGRTISRHIVYLSHD